ncbi:hypothetical protein SODALDRAFT_221996 [Sodiomyces alkalinus F11]|uniref:Uncharacterized protein n=1 Tax=Sodiomyces alkalinus (strain CBS 110278 / VKM F-3762 / F11) TaxID=1314773 RepID=A0A3N2PPY6_SODAK|nr:hypothetical protein SODALDRAFT_221996 [Sodiomyces alkalinus F11]ROT36559.1 hypothetical protein SODALDRAFT_221996 [Sodiomyces alkalinus F11]
MVSAKCIRNKVNEGVRSAMACGVAWGGCGRGRGRGRGVVSCSSSLGLFDQSGWTKVVEIIRVAVADDDR